MVGKSSREWPLIWSSKAQACVEVVSHLSLPTYVPLSPGRSFEIIFRLKIYEFEEEFFSAEDC